MKLVIEAISEGNLRVEILAFMLRVAASCEMSDETFFHSVHMAEKVLTKLHQEYLEKVADKSENKIKPSEIGFSKAQNNLLEKP